MPQSTSYEEKSVWIQSLTILGVLGTYFVKAGSMLQDGNFELTAYARSLVGSVIVLVIVIVGGHVFAALMATPEKADERDQLIAWKSGSRSSWILVLGILTALCAMILEMEVLKGVLQIVSYRRGV